MNKSRKFLSMVLAALLTLTFLSGVAQATVPAAKDGVVIATAQEPTHFFNQDEQYLTSQAKDGPVLMQLYDTLYWMGEDGSCQPSLATSYEVSDDGMEYVFELRDDVYFHNGEKMTAEEALTQYKGRDSSEKLFRGDKSYLGDKAARVYGSESFDTKVFIEFVALIIRNRIYTCLKNETQKREKKVNFMTVPAALRELDKIEMIKGSDNEYRLDHAVTATQKAILNVFRMTSNDIKMKAKDLSAELARIAMEAAEKKANEKTE